MNYWCHNELQEDGSNKIITLSEDEIIEKYWDYWHARMIDKFGQEHVDKNYCPQDCIDDWVIVHFAWLSTED